MLEVHLQTGFVCDTALVWADGDEVGEIMSASTDPATGLAGILRRAVDAGHTTALTITVPSQGLRRRIVVLPHRTPWIGVSIAEHRVRFRLSDRPFCYDGRSNVSVLRLATTSASRGTRVRSRVRPGRGGESGGPVR